VRRIVLVGQRSAPAEGLLSALRAAFPGAGFWLISPTPNPEASGLSGAYSGSLTDPALLSALRAIGPDLVIPLEPYGLMGEARPELETFALSVGARAVAVHEDIYRTVRIATRSHLRYRLYIRPWVCRAFGAVTLLCVVAPLYAIYWVARRAGLWRGGVAEEGT
jgi:hypothetical protein